jgi:hypothetical protein
MSCRRFLLLRDRAFAWAFSGARIGVRTLSADGQVTAMTIATIKPISMSRLMFIEILQVALYHAFAS